MRKFFAILVLFVIFTVTASAELYPQTFIINDIDWASNTTELLDYRGDAWIWEGAKHWTCGDAVIAIMNNNDTEIIYDDEIVMLYYANGIGN